MGQSSKHQSLRFLIGTLLFVTAAIVPQSIKASLGPSGLRFLICPRFTRR